jgi:GntR family phosphonate transport system transcriptional regulator
VRYNDSLQTQGRTSHYHLLQADEILAEPKIAEYLQLQVGDRVFQVDLLGLADDRPLIISTSYFPADRFPDLLSHVQTIQSISHLLRTVYDCDHMRLQTTVSTRAVRLQDARRLQIPLTQPILLVQAINGDQRGQIIEYTVTRFRGDGVELVFNH